MGQHCRFWTWPEAEVAVRDSNQPSPLYPSPEALMIPLKAGSLGVEEKAGGLSGKAFPKGLPTHHPGKSQIQASF